MMHNIKVGQTALLVTVGEEKLDVDEVVVHSVYSATVEVEVTRSLKKGSLQLDKGSAICVFPSELFGW